MFIRKHKGKIALSIAAVFWAACDNNSSSNSFEYIGGYSCDDDERAPGCQAIALYGVPSYDMSSAEISGNCDEGFDCAESSSSANITQASSSSNTVTSSSSEISEYPNMLATDSTVHCKDSLVTYDIFTCFKAAKRARHFLSEVDEPVYGVPTPNTPICGSLRSATTSFVCTDGNIYAPPKYIEKDGVVYEDTTITEEQKNLRQTIVPADQSLPK